MRKKPENPHAMFLPVFRDLIKPQWLAVIELLKKNGAMPVSDIARLNGASYMAVKAHCLQLTESGYLKCIRMPRGEVGRPEILYCLAEKADSLFPQAGVDFALDLLEEIRAMHGDSTPERLLFQHFAKTTAEMEKMIAGSVSSLEKARKLAALRNKKGHASTFVQDQDGAAGIVEHHNPLHRVFLRFPRSVAMEQRMIEQLLGCRVTRTEESSGRESAPRVVFQLVM